MALRQPHTPLGRPGVACAQRLTCCRQQRSCAGGRPCPAGRGAPRWRRPPGASCTAAAAAPRLPWCTAARTASRSRCTARALSETGATADAARAALRIGCQEPINRQMGSHHIQRLKNPTQFCHHSMWRTVQGAATGSSARCGLWLKHEGKELFSMSLWHRPSLVENRMAGAVGIGQFESW